VKNFYSFSLLFLHLFSLPCISWFIFYFFVLYFYVLRTSMGLQGVNSLGVSFEAI